MPVITESCPKITTEDGQANCLLYGGSNPWSLNLSFTPEADGSVTAQFKAHSGLQGYDGILYGGVIAALLDAAMTHCLLHHNVQAMTGDLRVRFVNPVGCNDLLAIKAWIVESCPPLYHLQSEITVDSCIMARGKARFMHREGLSCPRQS